MKRFWILLIFLMCLCRKEPPLPPNIEKFSGPASLNTNLSAGEPMSVYETENLSVRLLGARGAQTAAPWASLNPTGTTYDLTPLNNPYFGLSKLASYGYSEIFLNIPIITISTRSMPADIVSLPFNHPDVKNRFVDLINTIKDLLIPEVKYVSLGNEVDTYLSLRPGEWAPYRELVDFARQYLKAIKPSIQVGVTTTFSGATASYVNQIQSLTQGMDASMLTYYPTGPGFVPRPPSTVLQDVDAMFKYCNKPIILQECGYPSSSVLGSSEELQAEFIKNALREFERHGPEIFAFVSIFKYRDWSPSYVETITGQKSGQPFYEFMSSLGVKRNDGTPKKAHGVLETWLKN